MAKIKYVRFSKQKFLEIFMSSKILSKSLEDANVIIKQFNSLNQKQREDIVKEYSKSEDILKEKLNSPNEDMYLTCIMVNFNILATKYNVDPATICMCIGKPCRANEKISII